MIFSQFKKKAANNKAQINQKMINLNIIILHLYQVNLEYIKKLLKFNKII